MEIEGAVTTASEQRTLHGAGELERRAEQSAVRWGKGLLRFLRTKPLGTVGAVIIVAIIILAVFAPVFAPYGFDHRVLKDKLLTPSLKHPMGTDLLGRDVLSRIIYGARVSAFVGFGSVLISTIFATLIGTVSGYFGGKVDTIVQRLVDILLAFPAFILLLAIVAAFGTPTSAIHLGPISFDPAQQRAGQVVFAIGLLFIAPASRVIRGAALAVRNNLYVEGARTVGASDLRILLRYVLPNVAPTIIVYATLQLGYAILAEATLAFLAFGIPDPVPSWGLMLSGLARARIRQDPWLAFWPGLAISLAVFGFNMLGDALRDVLDPRLRGSR
ncbi:MAG TPA: ABC transporter permease [Dehalococcoidia bacterium]|nr:ABC transporter permease [Dehalococcoidia bacterium]